MITERVDRKEDENGVSYLFTIKINKINEWKFMRWLDIMNSYDDLRKSKYNYYSLLKEVENDYAKDFKERD